MDINGYPRETCDCIFELDRTFCHHTSAGKKIAYEYRVVCQELAEWFDIARKMEVELDARRLPIREFRKFFSDSVWIKE